MPKIGVYDYEKQQSREQLTANEMKAKSIEELQREQEAFRCAEFMYHAEEDARNYCVALANAIKAKQEAGEGNMSGGFVDTDPSSGIYESHTSSKSGLILENHRKNKKVHPIAKRNWWYDA